MIEQDSNGVYHKKDAVISTGEVWESAIIHTHQQELLRKGIEALDNIPKDKRDISHLTITASAPLMDLIIKNFTTTFRNTGTRKK